MKLGSRRLIGARYPTSRPAFGTAPGRVSMVSCVLVGFLGFGCSKDGGAFDSSTSLTTGISLLGDTDEEGDGDGDEMTSSNDGPLLDMDGDNETGPLPCGEGDFCDCDVPEHVPCASAADTPIARAMGLNCPNELQVSISTSGSAAAIGKRSSFGNTNAFAPQEGSQYVAMGSGRVDELDGVGGCNSDLGAHDPGELPAPLVRRNVAPQTCADNPALGGMGDCSNTIAGQLAGSVNDYTELRFTAQVPSTVNSISYSLAFFSYEYPQWYLSEFNDMYIGWLES